MWEHLYRSWYRGAAVNVLMYKSPRTERRRVLMLHTDLSRYISVFIHIYVSRCAVRGSCMAGGRLMF